MQALWPSRQLKPAAVSEIAASMSSMYLPHNPILFSPSTADAR